IWDLLNSAGRWTAICDHTGDIREPRAVRRNALYAACRSSDDSECHQIIKSASAFSALTSYVPRTITSSSASLANNASTSVASASRSASPRTRSSLKTDHIVNRIVSLICLANLPLLAISVLISPIIPGATIGFPPPPWRWQSRPGRLPRDTPRRIWLGARPRLHRFRSPQRHRDVPRRIAVVPRPTFVRRWPPG